jgi:hypothetical protein
VFKLVSLLIYLLKTLVQVGRFFFFFFFFLGPALGAEPCLLEAPVIPCCPETLSFVLDFYFYLFIFKF